MSTKARKGICYSFILLFIVYFAVVGAYFVSQTATAFRIWEFMIMLSGPLSLLFLVSVLDDTTHNAYWVLSVVFAAASMLTTMLAHYENILTGTGEAAFQTNDSLAWGVFFGAACLCAALTLKKDDKKRKTIRILFVIIGIMCFLGLLGPLTHIDALWFIAVAGYGPVALVLCFTQLKYLRTL
ncbi:MAG TPA: hypothetical protein VHO70_14065 [Chitinispirillaceae bacterium]|nr:hypothetical protein [Chitinispirillaceae bacterium]